MPRRVAERAAADADVYRTRPPILVNSFPKSGTHLLLQVLGAFPAVRDLSRFCASMPSLRHRERSVASTTRTLRWVVPGELMGAHLFYNEAHATALRNLHYVHYFIYRDLRDVVVSEAHYLTSMNRWHRLHRVFSALPDDRSRIRLAIEGAPDPTLGYPNIRRRLERYRAWLGRDDVICVRFEDLLERRETTIRRLAVAYLERAGLGEANLDQWVARAQAAIDPAGSRTFRRGEIGSWRAAFDQDARQHMDAVAGDLLIELGYEPDHSWANSSVS